ncbi:hypothetical protein M422DRAFT_25872 [Sphaerobolus stellatus SS14]|nr:hypothetical protein M422DRAFT_25872 [Sphaerobolus stellatus SS14]
MSQLSPTSEDTSPKEAYPTNPHIMHLSPEQWENWLAEHSILASWRSKGIYHSQPKSGRKCKIDWSNRYECSHAGSYRDMRKDNVRPSKKRKRGPSTKVQCQAKILVSKPCDSDLLQVQYFWQHSHHEQQSSNSEAGRAWLNARVNEGFDQKTIKAMLEMSEEDLAKINVNERLPHGINISAQDIYNAMRRKANSKGKTTSGSREGSEAAKGYTDSDSLSFEEAESEVAENTQLNPESSSTEALEDDQSHPLIPTRRSREPDLEEEEERAWKRRAIDQIQDDIKSLSTDMEEFWRQVENDETILDSISLDGLTRLLAATEDFGDMLRDTFS